MFKKIEYLYKKKSPYNRIKIKLFCAYLITIFLLWCLNIYNIYWMMLLILIISFFAVKYICEKELNTKLYIIIWKKDNSGKPLNEIIHCEEKQLFKNFLKKEKIYNKEVLACIIDHYRVYIRQNIIGDNFWAIIAIIISIALAFVTKDGFDIKSFEQALPYLFALVFVTIIIYYPIKKFPEIKKFFKGEDGIYENLEIIFSELYIEYKEEKIDTKKKATKHKKQVKPKKNKSVVPGINGEQLHRAR